MYDTPEQRQIDRERDYRKRREIYPSQRAQSRYPSADHPCSGCDRQGPPHLVDNGSEFYWEHHAKGFGRGHCEQFGRGRGHPRPGTATSLWRLNRRTWQMIPRTEEEYLAAQKAVEEDGADDAEKRRQ